jgi:2Fe-2S ferredoxin
MVRILATDRDGVQHEIAGEAGKSLMRNLKETGGLDIAAICGGSCACGTCHVLVAPDWYARLAPPGVEETEMIQDDPAFVAGQSRLACQIPVTEALSGIRLTLAQGE